MPLLNVEDSAGVMLDEAFNDWDLSWYAPKDDVDGREEDP
jgi:hypothetical protein